MRFNELMRSNFSGCRLLHQGIDPNRHRPAKYFALPGEFALIGYTDDTDSFIIPVSVYVPREATEALRAIQEGRTFTVAPIVRRRTFNDAPVVTSTRQRREFHG